MISTAGEPTRRVGKRWIALIALANLGLYLGYFAPRKGSGGNHDHLGSSSPAASPSASSALRAAMPASTSAM